MQVAVVAVRMVQRAAHFVVHVIPVRNGVMAARAAVLPLALDGSAASGATPVDVESMLVGMGFVRGVEVPIVEIVGMISVPHRLVPAIRPMLVRM